MTIEAATIEAAIFRVRAFARSQGWAAFRYASAARLGETTLRDFDKPDWNPTADTLRKLEAVIPDGWQPDPLADAARQPIGGRMQDGDDSAPADLTEPGAKDEAA